MDANFTSLTTEMVERTSEVYNKYRGYTPVATQLAGTVETYTSSNMLDKVHKSVQVSLGDDASDADIARKLNDTDTELLQLNARELSSSFIEFYKTVEFRYTPNGLINKASFDQAAISNLIIQQDRESLQGDGGNSGYQTLAVELAAVNALATQEDVISAISVLIDSLMVSQTLSGESFGDIDVLVPTSYFSLLRNPAVVGTTIFTGLDLLKSKYPNLTIKSASEMVEKTGKIYASYRPALKFNATMLPAVIENANVRYASQEAGSLYGFGSTGFEIVGMSTNPVVCIGAQD